MTGAHIVFRAGALIALLFLVRYTLRRDGRRDALWLVGFLVLMAALREWAVVQLSSAISQPVPYTPDPSLGQIGTLNLVLIAGWVFTILLSLELARLVQQRNFPGTNVFFTLALAALVTTAVSYSIETCGTAIHLWTWRHPSTVGWLPFDWPFDAFEGWAATSLTILLAYCGLRYRLFSTRRWISTLSHDRVDPGGRAHRPGTAAARPVIAAQEGHGRLPPGGDRPGLPCSRVDARYQRGRRQNGGRLAARGRGPVRRRLVPPAAASRVGARPVRCRRSEPVHWRVSHRLRVRRRSARPTVTRRLVGRFPACLARIAQPTMWPL